MNDEIIKKTMSQHGVKLSPSAEAQLRTYLETEGELSIVKQRLKPLMRLSTKVGTLVKEGVAHLAKITEHAVHAGLKLKVPLCFLLRTVNSDLAKYFLYFWSDIFTNLTKNGWSFCRVYFRARSSVNDLSKSEMTDCFNLKSVSDL